VKGTVISPPCAVPTTGWNSELQFFACVIPRIVTMASAASSMARKMPVITALSRMFKMAIPAATSITMAPMTLRLTFTITARYVPVPRAITAGMKAMKSTYSANVTKLTGPASHEVRPLNECQTRA
jgi:hypothetical protein